MLKKLSKFKNALKSLFDEVLVKRDALQKKILKFEVGFELLLSELFAKQDASHIQDTPKKLYDSLNPKSLEITGSVQNYLETLEYCITDKDIRNVALSGIYGSGKSSLIKTFIEHNRGEYKFLNISLASFDDTTDYKIVEEKVELSIIQQIIYHVDSNKIPDSRFKRIKNITRWQMFKALLSFFILLLSGFIIYNFNYLESLNPNTWSWQFSNIDYTAIVLYSSFLIAAFSFGRRIVKFFNNSRLSKITLKGEFGFDNIDKSILNEHLDELLYFFERNHYDMVVIEDLDRFKNSLTVFTKLREINILINQSEQRKNKNKIVFLYAIKDEIFANAKERTKFFDFIIPVIPIINQSNSGSKLRKRLLSGDESKDPSEQFLEDVSIFIDDMRLLNNICNEYQIYRNILSPKLKPDRLLAIIIYKNLKPEDFRKLNEGNSLINEIVNERKKFTDNHIRNKDKEITELQNQINKIQNESTNSLRELRVLFLFELNNIIENFHAIIIKGERLIMPDLLEDVNFEKLKGHGNFQYHTATRNGIQSGTINNLFKELESKFDSESSYDEREQSILDNNSGKISVITNQIKSLRKSKSRIPSWSLSKLISEENLDNGLSEEAKNDRLLMFLIKNGYIKEDYFDYLSYFYVGSITDKDNDFLQSVKSKIRVDPDYRLDKKIQLVKKIGLEHFNDKYVLNHDLVDTICGEDQFSDKKSILIDYLIMNKKLAIDFILSYPFKGKPSNHPIRLISKKDPLIWYFIEQSPDFDTSNKLNLLKLIINYVDLEDIARLAKDSELRNYLNKLSNPIDFFRQINLQSKALSVISELNAKFKNLKLSIESDEEIFNYVVINDHYSINKDNIELLLLDLNRDLTNNELNDANYTTILNYPDTSLYKYVHANFSLYTKNILLKSGRLIETQEAITLIMNNPDVKNDQKLKIIDLLEVELNDLSLIDSMSDKINLIRQRMIEVSWSNVLNYFLGLNDNKIDEHLINYLNDPLVYLGLKYFNEKPTGYKLEEFKKLQLAIIYCNDLDDEAYEHFIGSGVEKWGNLVLKNLEFDKVKILVRLEALEFSVQNYDELKDDFPNLHINFLIDHFRSFLLNPSMYHLETHDYLSLLKSELLIPEYKVRLIKEIKQNVIIENKDLGVEVAKVVSARSVKGLDYDLVYSLFLSSESNSHRIEIFNNNLEQFSRDQIMRLMNELSNPYARLLRPRLHTHLERNDINELFVQNLMSLDIISSYETKGDQIKVIAKY